MIFDPIEAIKFIGGIGGILSTGFLIYDRLYKSQPTIFFQPHDATACLVIKNTMTETLFIDAIDVSPRKLSFAFGDDIHSTIEAVVGAAHDSSPERNSLIIGPLSERYCRLVKLTGFDELPPETPFTIRCAWRNTRRPSYVKQSVKVSTTAGDLTRIRNDATRD
ncbi:hypothetical protein V1290_003803 [Bradyrhizobium sp. AZCC 1578]|uniref:hypothetical protein n=1 Tax=Bradyrhizobium sp. AZCC 1578 TaxID=3117027 RepID=UPI002FEE96C2